MLIHTWAALAKNTTPFLFLFLSRSSPTQLSIKISSSARRGKLLSNISSFLQPPFQSTSFTTSSFVQLSMAINMAKKCPPVSGTLISLGPREFQYRGSDIIPTCISTKICQGFFWFWRQDIMDAKIYQVLVGQF